MRKVEPIRDKKKISKILYYLRRNNERDFILFMLGLYTGLRISDILNLRVRDIRNKEHIYIKEQKTGKNKRFKVNSELRQHLNKFTRNMSGYEYIIQSREGINQSISRVRAYQIIRETGELFGIEGLSCHSLRKSFGYWHYKQYKNIAELMEIFNHSHEKITLRYIGIIQEEIDESVEGLSFL